MGCSVSIASGAMLTVKNAKLMQSIKILKRVNQLMTIILNGKKALRCISCTVVQMITVHNEYFSGHTAEWIIEIAICPFCTQISVKLVVRISKRRHAQYGPPNN